MHLADVFIIVLFYYYLYSITVFINNLNYHYGLVILWFLLAFKNIYIYISFYFSFSNFKTFISFRCQGNISELSF